MENIFEIKNLNVSFSSFGETVSIVRDFSLAIGKGEIVGIVGESGCGKSTLGRTIIGLLDATEGTVLFDGKSVTKAKGEEKKQLRRNMQLIFQDPYSSLNPRLCVYDLIAEPLRIYKVCRNKKELRRRVFELMDTAGLARRLAFSYPHELDGGRRQRVGIARALALDPRFIVCDEPVSALDVSIQAQILNLLQDLQEAHGLSYVFITHDLSVVKHISNDIMVMYLGTTVEYCESERLFERPLHPYTAGLLSAIPVPTLGEKPQRILLRGEITSPVDPPECCRFAARCPYASVECSRAVPPLEEAEPGHRVACFRWREIDVQTQNS